jgi:hypothetical protein
MELPARRQESMLLGVCQSYAMGVPGIDVSLSRDDSESAVRFLIQ